MTTFLLLWDGSAAGYDPDDYLSDQRETSRGQQPESPWSFGRRVQGASPGDRVFLLRQRTDRGIVASGYLSGERGIYDGPHWDPEHGGTMKYVDVKWDVVVALEDRLRTEVLLSEVPVFQWNFVRASGHELYSPADSRVEELWSRHVRTLRPGYASGFAVDPVGDDDLRAYAVIVPLEAKHIPSYDVVSFTSTQAVRRESQLVDRLKSFLEAGGHQVERYRVPQPGGAKLFTDIVDTTDNILWEAKGVATREAVRMAIGQVLDYRRFIRPRPRLAVLLPECPVSDLQDLLRSVEVELWYEDGDSFVQAEAQSSPRN